MNAIKIKNLTKVIKGQSVLKDINLNLVENKIYGFFGRNGSGKTMLFRAIAGLIKPTKGEIFIFGKQLGKDYSFPPDIGIIIENVGFWPQYTGFENLKLLASIRKRISDNDIKNAIKDVGLEPNDKRIYKKYSLGMKQRLGIAQALMEKPQLIVLDEPTNGLDNDGISSFRELLLKEKKRGATILLTSHNKEDINLLSDEKYYLEDGKCFKKSEDWK